MTIQTLREKLHAAKAVIVSISPQLAGLQAQRDKAQAEFDRFTQIANGGTSLTREEDDARAVAKQNKAHAAQWIAKRNEEITRARKDVAYLERLLNSESALEQARQNWLTASEAQVAATKNAEDLRAAVQTLNTMLTEELARKETASAAQRAAVLADLGVGKNSGESVSEASKTLASCELKIDALRADAIPAAQFLVDTADFELGQCDKATRAAEAAIVKAHADKAELAHVLAMEAFAKTLLEYHGTQMAAFGTFGTKPDFYEPGDTRDGYLLACEGVVKRVKEAAEQGE